MAKNYDYQYIAELVRRTQMGNNDSFAELYMATYARQYKYAYHYLKDDGLAQDALQETYTTAFKKILSLKDPLLFLSWINQICFHICFRIHEKKGKINELGEKKASIIPDSAYNPEDQKIIVDDVQYEIKQVETLPTTEAQVIILYYYNHIKVAEISKMMEISRGNVIRYMNSGKKKLAKLLT